MKSLLVAGLMALTFASVAQAEYSDDCKRGHDSDGDCIDAQYFKCYVKDGARNMFTSDSNGFYDTTIVQYRAMKQCRAESPRPATCKPLGCQTY